MVKAGGIGMVGVGGVGLRLVSIARGMPTSLNLGGRGRRGRISLPVPHGRTHGQFEYDHMPIPLMGVCPGHPPKQRVLTPFLFRRNKGS